VDAFQRLPPQHCPVPIRVRLGIDTGPVVISPIAVGRRQEHLALGDTPHLAVRLLEPDRQER
jgi:class 3 adenylate cyclase